MSDKPQTPELALYCAHCGFRRDLASEECGVCGGSELAPPQEPSTVLLDLSRRPFGALRHDVAPWLRHIGLWPLILIMLLRLAFARLLRRPLYVLARHAALPGYQPLGRQDPDAPIPRRLERALQRNGWQPVLRFVDEYSENPAVQHLWRHEAERLLLILSVRRPFGILEETGVFALTEDGRMVSAINRVPLAERTTPRAIREIVPGAGVEVLAMRVRETAARQGLTFAAPDPARFLPLLHGETAWQLHAAMQSGMLIRRSRKGERAWNVLSEICSNHQGVPAVRVCRTCRKPLCDECYEERGGAYYCAFHAPPVTDPPPPQSAAWIVRALAAGVDLAAAFGPSLLVIGALVWGDAQWFADPVWRAPVAMALVTLPVAILAWAWVVQPLRHGATPGMRLLGLRVCDRWAKPPSVESLTLRLVWFFFSLLLWFPAIGYLLALGRDGRAGHERISGLYTVEA